MLICTFLRRNLRFLVPLLFVGNAGLQAQNCVLICNQNLQVSLDPNGEAFVTSGLIAPTATAYCPGQLEVELFSNLGEPIPNPVTCEWTNQLITAEITHLSSGNTCSGTLLLRDLLPPHVQCPELWIACSASTTPESLGFPIAADNCTPPDALFYVSGDNYSDLPCGSQHNGMNVTARLQRAWTVRDEHNNSSFCMQDIWIQAPDLSSIAFPPSLDGFALPALVCSGDPNNLAVTGQPLINGQPLAPNGWCDLAVVHSDQNINVCPPAAFTVLRTWTVADFCNSNVVTYLQVIKIEDQMPPQLALPQDVTVGTGAFDCKGTIVLNMPNATDDCSAVLVSALWSFGSGQGPFTVPLGEHVVTYVATDGCGNTASRTGRVTVVDTNPPQVVCTISLQVSLTGSGTAMVTPAMLDEGSIDACGPVTFSLSRDGENWLPLVVVGCDDIGSSVAVTLRVTDAAGMENFCDVNVQVYDQLKPQLTCPPNKTITCLQDFQDLSLCGEASASDNCFLQTIDYEDFVNLSTCQTGTVERTWYAEDASNNIRSCTQVMVLQVVSNLAVLFPQNVEAFACFDSNALLPPSTGMPQLSGQFCLQPSVSYDDVVTGAPVPYCFRVLRTWTVIDWCVYDVNTGAGRWDHTQIIDALGQSGFVLEGQVFTATGQPMESVAIHLQSTGGLLLTILTDASGHYRFSNVPNGANYVLTPMYDSLWLNGLSTYDLVLINKHILGIETFDLPYTMIAGDANKSRSVTTFDIAQLRKLILGVQDTLTGNHSWRFVDAAYQFPQPDNAFFEVFPENIQLPTLSSNHLNLDFIGVKTGDVNGSANFLSGQ